MSTKTKQFTLAVQIAGSINKSFGSSLKSASAQLSTFQKKINSLNATFTSLDKGYDKIMSAGKAAFKVVSTSAFVATAAVTAASVAAISVGKEFETAFAGVKKTVNATDVELAQLRDDIIEMSQVIPSSAVEIAGVMEIAGQLGIATKNLTDFTETMINLGVSTNLSAEEAATALAKFATVTGMDPSDYERLGSTIVDLGNNFATTEADIVAMATRLAATGELTGLTEAQILAMATAMSSVGIAAESGGSTMSKLLKKIQVAVETGSGSLEQYAEVANMSVEKFSDTFRDDAVVALSAFLDGLNDTERLGKSAIVVLEDMELKEVRLSNTILSLANSSESMTKAIDMANKAWEENTALQEEADKRYETTDSKIQMMVNSFKALGIAAYDELQGPFRGALDWITEGVQNLTEDISSSSGISKWISDISTKIPTAIRKVKGVAGDLLDFFSPLIGAAKWLWDNPDCLSTAFVSLGTALITYKIASTMTHIVSSLMTIASNPAALAIMGVAAGVSAIAGAFYYMDKQHQKLVRAKIDEGFGDIALSLEELEEVANHLINSDGALTKLHEAFSAFEELDTIQDGVDNAMQAVNKINWKVSIGMDLSEDDKTAYRESIAEYIAECENYATQQQYSLALAVNLVYDKDDVMGMSILDSINQFYNDNLSELQILGTKLNDAITEAFTDGLLDIDEAKEIQELMQQISDIQNALANSNFDAALTSLALDYGLGSGVQLDADTFMNLQEEINEQLAAFKDENTIARDKLIQNSALRYNQGYITKEQYDAEVASIAEKYNALYDEKAVTALEFMTRTINESGILQRGYEDAYSAAYNALASSDLLGENADMLTPKMVYEQVQHFYNEAMGAAQGELDIMAEAADELMEALRPSYQQLIEQKEFYESIGKDIPEYIISGINAYEEIEDIRSAANVPSKIVEEILSSSENATVIREKLEAYGKSFDEMIAQGMIENKSMITGAIDKVLSETYSNMQKDYSGLAIRFNANASRFDLLDPLGLNELPGHADGGIFTVPHIAAFAERGPEAAIPIDGSDNAISLWKRTGQLLGMGSVLDGIRIEGGSSSTIEYKPTLIFQGEAPSKDDIEEALDMSYEKFESMMDRYMRERRRVAF